MVAASLALLAWVLHCNSVLAALPEVLVYSKTAGYRHESIPVAIDAIQQIATSTNLFTPTFSEDETLFREATLAPFSVIAFLSNSEQVLDNEGEAALQQWLTKGRGLIGLHSATACLFEDEAFGVAMGSWFDYHPTISNASFVKIPGVTHPTIDMLPNPYVSFEEVYHFRSDPRAVNATVILSVDESSYSDPQAGTRPYYEGPPGAPLPIVWYRNTPVDLGNGTQNGTMAGPMWMTSLGHTNDTWRSPTHLAHVQAGFEWVLQQLSATNSTPLSIPSASGGPASSASTGNTTPSASPSRTGGAFLAQVDWTVLLSTSVVAAWMAV